MTALSLLVADVQRAIDSKTTSADIVVYSPTLAVLDDLQKNVVLKPLMNWEIAQKQSHVIARVIWKRSISTPLEPAADGQPIVAVSFERILLAEVTVLLLSSTAGVSPKKLYLLGTNEFIETNVVLPMTSTKGCFVYR